MAVLIRASELREVSDSRRSRCLIARVASAASTAGGIDDAGLDVAVLALGVGVDAVATGELLT